MEINTGGGGVTRVEEYPPTPPHPKHTQTWEIIQGLLSNYLLLVTGHTEMAACGNINLCAGLITDIKGAVHATLAECGKARCQPTDAG